MKFVDTPNSTNFNRIQTFQSLRHIADALHYVSNITLHNFTITTVTDTMNTEYKTFHETRTFSSFSQQVQAHSLDHIEDSKKMEKEVPKEH